MLRRIFLIWCAVFWAVPAHAKPPTLEFAARAALLVEVLKTEGREQDLFAPSFLAQVPTPEVRRIARELAANGGGVQGVQSIDTVSATVGVVYINYERTMVRFNITIDAKPPAKIIGLLVASIEARGDSLEKIIAEFKALPGTSGFVLIPLGQRNAPPIASYNADASFAVGSSFKLWVLAELNRAIAANERRWSDVVPLGPASLPSGMTQRWPPQTAMTLQSLATLMISISDNTASDTLLKSLGRDRVGDMVRRTGHSAPQTTLPILSTLESFTLKMQSNAQLRARWITGSQAQRRTLLETQQAHLGMTAIDPAQLVGTPNYVGVEWFASPNDLARTLDWFRVNASKETRDILAVNSGLAPGDVDRFDYVGFKGGSEPGVIALNFIVRNKRGAWYAATGSWNDPNKEVDHNRFLGLMARALVFVR